MESFTIIVLPDTQHFSYKYPELFTNQTQWIVDNKDELNIVFVTHVGDIVAHYSRDPPTEWDRANTSMSILDGKVPYGMCPGNHDGAHETPYGITNNFAAYFPFTRYESESWYGGHVHQVDGYYESDNRNNANYQLFSAGGDDYIIIHLQYCPWPEHRAWANNILQTYSDRKAIITTHGYIEGKYRTDAAGDLLMHHAAGEPINDGNGEDIWNDIVVPNENVFMVLCGHTADEYLRIDHVGDRTVYGILQDYADRIWGDQNFLRIMTFVPDEDKIYVKTYSPMNDKYETDANSQFELDFVMTGSPKGTIIGTVTDKDTELPLSGVAVIANGYSTITD